MVELGMVPRHDESAGRAGTSAHGGAPIGVVSESYMSFFFHQWKYLVLHKLSVFAGHSVIFKTALAALRIAGPVRDGNGDHHRQPVCGDETIERGEEQVIGPVCSHDEGRFRAGDVLFGHVDRYLTRV